MPFSPDRHLSKSKDPFLLRNSPSFPDLWFYSTKPLKPRHHVLLNMHFTSPPVCPRPLTLETGPTSLLSDTLLLHIFSLLPLSQHNPNSLVCRRWLFLFGRLRRALKLLDWQFLLSGRLAARFPNLTHIDLVSVCAEFSTGSCVVLTHRLLSLPMDPANLPLTHFLHDENFLRPYSIDNGLRMLARGCHNLRKLALFSPTDAGFSSFAINCPTIHELELHRCTDLSLSPLSAFPNLQNLRLVAAVDGVYNSVVSDIGLTILAHGCKQLVKLELCGCEGSYDGIKAIGKCCLMLEELTISNHRMDGGWIGGLTFCGNLKTLRLVGCKRIDPVPGAAEDLGPLPSLERLQLQQCQMRDKQSVGALFTVCEAVKEIIFHDCWGLDNGIFSIAAICRRITLLDLKGCPSLTTEGLEFVVHSWADLERLRIVSCNNIRDSEVTPALSSLFSVLKEFTWRPDSRSIIASIRAGMGMGSKRRSSFKRA